MKTLNGRSISAHVYSLLIPLNGILQNTIVYFSLFLGLTGSYLLTNLILCTWLPFDKEIIFIVPQRCKRFNNIFS